jgi:hypothetical protein
LTAILDSLFCKKMAVTQEGHDELEKGSGLNQGLAGRIVVVLVGFDNAA